MTDTIAYDFVVIGAGSAGCAVAHQLARFEAGSILVIEAGPSDRWPLVRAPFGLVWTIGSRRRDWRYTSVPQENAAGRRIGIPRGRMIGGSGSINSMVWFRGRTADFDGWGVPGWTGADVRPAFEDVEAHLRPRRLEGAHPLTEALGGLFGNNDPTALPNPERTGAGVFEFNLHDGRRWSAADAFLRPAMEDGRVAVLQSSPVDRLGVTGDRVDTVHFSDGTSVRARKGVVLSAGAIGSPEILLRSGIGPADDLRAAGRDVVRDMPQVGRNLHDHPGAGIHYKGDGSGYGLTLGQAPTWAIGPLRWLLQGKGVFASPSVEGGGFFNARGENAEPDIQSHFIPFLLDWTGRKYVAGQGYFADAVLCRPKSRGSIRIAKSGLEIDLGLFNEESDLETLTHGWLRLRALMAEADLGPHKAPEAFPGAMVGGFESARDYIRARCGTAYHPVGTLRLGAGDAPVDERLRLRGLDGLWVADASVMPQVTSANTNAPSMMIGYRAGRFIAQDAA